MAVAEAGAASDGLRRRQGAADWQTGCLHHCCPRQTDYGRPRHPRWQKDFCPRRTPLLGRHERQDHEPGVSQTGIKAVELHASEK